MPLSRTASAKCSAYYTDTAIQYNVSPSIVKKNIYVCRNVHFPNRDYATPAFRHQHESSQAKFPPATTPTLPATMLEQQTSFSQSKLKNLNLKPLYHHKSNTHAL